MPSALIIDDDPQNLEVLGNLLSLENIAYTPVQDPAQLEGVLKDYTGFDIVFLDLEFPDTDGYEVLKYLKEKAKITAPIVACTVHLSEMNNASRHGFSGFVGKPLDPDRFSEQVKRLLSGGPVWELR
jgi:two-component system cell cycle response regulator DivK